MPRRFLLRARAGNDNAIRKGCMRVAASGCGTPICKTRSGNRSEFEVTGRMRCRASCGVGYCHWNSTRVQHTIAIRWWDCARFPRDTRRSVLPWFIGVHGELACQSRRKEIPMRLHLARPANAYDPTSGGGRAATARAPVQCHGAHATTFTILLSRARRSSTKRRRLVPHRQHTY